MKKSTTRPYDWERAKEMLMKKGVSEEKINTLISGKEDSLEKKEALKPLMEEYKIDLYPDKSPSLQKYFNKNVSDLLIRRKRLMDILGNKDLSSMADKKLSELSKEDIDIYLRSETFRKELSEINAALNKALKGKGISFS